MNALRKKSHILLAKYMADQMIVEESLQSHRKAFCFGNILPDIKPSFITTRHEFFGTFEYVQDKMRFLVENGTEVCNERAFWRKLGEVLHYIADYFTFPHNHTYEGSFVEHNHYEKELKDDLKSYILSGKAVTLVDRSIHFENLEQLMKYIKQQHEKYLKKIRDVADDIQYILSVCFQVLQGLIQLCTNSVAQAVQPAVSL